MNDKLLSLKQIFFPPKCPTCGEILPTGQFCCKACAKKFHEDIVKIYNLPIGKKSRIFTVFSAEYYENYYKKYIERFKFYGKTSYATQLAKLMYKNCKEHLEGFDAITYVPMTKKAMAKRGYNQAELLAKDLAHMLDLPLVKVLDKIRDTYAQHTLGANERHKNIKNAYKVSIDISGQKILIVDDIITTGATLCECAKTMYKSGATLVVGVTSANTH